MSKYVYKFTHNLLLEYFSSSFVLILYNSPLFIKFIKSGFIRYIDFRFLRFFQEIFFLCSEKSDKDIEIFVHKYFQKNIRKRFEEDLFYCLVRLVVKSAPESFQRQLIKYLKYNYLYNQAKYNYSGSRPSFKNNCNLFNNYVLIDELTFKYKINGFYSVNHLFVSDNYNMLYNLFFREKKEGKHKSFTIFRKYPGIGFIGLPFSKFINFKSNISLNVINKLNYFMSNHLLDFLFLRFLRLNILEKRGGSYFEAFYFYEFYLPTKHAVLFEFAVEGLKDFNYTQCEIYIPLHSNSPDKGI